MANQYRTYNLGPITTAFTPPPRCFQAYNHRYLTESRNPDQSHFIGQLGLTCSLPRAPDEIFLISDPRCVPSGTQSQSLASSLSQDGVPLEDYKLVYSPGLQCPSGWTAATAWVRDEEHTTPPGTGELYKQYYSEAWKALKSGDTWVDCCPDGFSIDGHVHGFQCEKSFHQNESFTMYTLDNACGEYTTTVTASGTGENEASGFMIAERLHLIVPAGSTFVGAVPTDSSPKETTAPKGTAAPKETGVADQESTGSSYTSRRLSLVAKVAIDALILSVVLAIA